jgi:hypothetical protein
VLGLGQGDLRCRARISRFDHFILPANRESMMVAEAARFSKRGLWHRLERLLRRRHFGTVTDG